MSGYKLAFFAVVAALLAAVLKKEKPEFSLLVQGSATVAILLSVATALRTVLQSLVDFTAQGNLHMSNLRLLTQALCVTTASEWAASFCRDAGLSALALAVELGTGVVLLSMCMPLLRTVLQFATGFFL